MINVRTIRKMQDGDILNLKNGNIKKYKGGIQVNTATVIPDTPKKANIFRALFTIGII